MRHTPLLLLASLLLLALGCTRTPVRPAATPRPAPPPFDVTPHTYAWLTNPEDVANNLTNRMRPPEGYARVPHERDSFADWLQHLPLKPGSPPVRLYNGREAATSGWHAAVVEIDTGTRDLQQCADAIMRLRAEYLYAHGRRDEIAFTYVSGFRADFARWARGYRPVSNGRSFAWARRARPDASHAALRAYLNHVFAYASTLSLARDLRPVRAEDLRVGDVFIRPGSPGHAALVVDMARHPTTGVRVMLLLQSFMPAQDMHIVLNTADPALSPWYPAAFGDHLAIPGYTFSPSEVKRFP